MNLVRIRTFAAAAACILFASVVAAGERADRIWSGGPILTMNDAAMRAEAVAEKGGRIIAVGSTADVMKTRGPKTEMIDLKGRTLVPGFIDGHGHVERWALGHQLLVWHGRRCCAARGPACSRCPVAGLFPKRGVPASARK